jgi:hypothetical protein
MSSLASHQLFHLSHPLPSTHYPPLILSPPPPQHQPHRLLSPKTNPIGCQQTPPTPLRRKVKRNYEEKQKKDTHTQQRGDETTKLSKTPTTQRQHLSLRQRKEIDRCIPKTYCTSILIHLYIPYLPPPPKPFYLSLSAYIKGEEYMITLRTNNNNNNNNNNTRQVRLSIHTTFGVYQTQGQPVSIRPS